MADRYVLCDELYSQLKPIFGLPDRAVISMSIDLPGACTPVSLQLTMMVSESESKELVKVLQKYQLEKKSEV